MIRSLRSFPFFKTSPFRVYPMCHGRIVVYSLSGTQTTRNPSPRLTNLCWSFTMVTWMPASLRRWMFEKRVIFYVRSIQRLIESDRSRHRPTRSSVYRFTPAGAPGYPGSLKSDLSGIYLVTSVRDISCGNFKVTPGLDKFSRLTLHQGCVAC